MRARPVGGVGLVVMVIEGRAISIILVWFMLLVVLLVTLVPVPVSITVEPIRVRVGTVELRKTTVGARVTSGLSILVMLGT